MSKKPDAPKLLQETPLSFWRRQKTWLLVVGIGIGLLILLFTLTKAYLFIQLLIGNDVLLDTTGTNASVSAYQGMSVALPLNVIVTTNPFCVASCDAVLRDVAQDTILEEKTFDIRTGNPYRTTYDVTLPKSGTGQTLYRWEVSCTAHANWLCHTSGIPVTRETITTVTYDYSTEARETRERERVRLLSTIIQAKTLGAIHSAISADLIHLSDTIVIDNELTDAISISATLTMIDASISRARAAWDTDNKGVLTQEITATQANITTVNTTLVDLHSRTDALLAHHESSIERLEIVREILASIAQEPIRNATIIAQASTTIAQYTTTRSQLADTRSTLSARETALTTLEQSVVELSSANTQDTLRDSLSRDAELAIILDALCTRGTCVTRLSITDVADLNVTERNASCERTRVALTNLASASTELETQAGADTQNATLVSRAEKIASDTIRESSMNAIVALNASNAQYVALVSNVITIPSPTGELDDPTITPLVSLALIDRIQSCPLPSITPPGPVGIPHIAPSAIASVNVSLILSDPTPQCCALGKCVACCDTSSCRASIPAPIIILHGHAFNRDTSAAYSLDAFEKIQRLLEKDGYLNMGTLDLSAQNIPDGSWSRARIPISVKASYYYDVYASPDNALQVQTKTENIDTYALRLKDIVDEVRRRTGQDHVTIVAHSMGGLVTRRYLQVFGDSAVERVVMIGTPNNGIIGSIADYCTYLGQDLECRDMTTGSLFLNKLNRAGTPNIPVSMIIGMGCDTDGEDGDGVVTVQNAALSWATNQYMTGVCGRFNTLHTDMLDTDLYPATYALLHEELVRENR